MIGNLVSKVCYLWRLFITALGFLFFGTGSLIVGFILFPLITLLVWSPKYKKIAYRRCIQYGFGSFLAFMHFAGCIRIKVKGFDRLNQDRGVIVVANHPCLIDTVALMAMLPGVTGIVKKKLWDNIFLGGPVQAAGYIPNDDSGQILDLCSGALARGENLLIFPEGTRTVPGQSMKIKRGAAQLALRAGGIPIRPVKITMEPSTLTKGEPWYSIPSRRADFIFDVGELIEPLKVIPADMKPSIAARRLSEMIYQNIDATK